MQITVDKAALAKGLQTVSRVVSPRNMIPILSNLALTAQGDSLHLVATDLDIEISLSISANVAVPGAATMNAKLLTEIARKMPTDQVTIEVKNREAVASSGRSKFNLLTLPVEDMPSLIVGEFTHHFEMPAADLRRLLKRCAFAISTEETRYYLNGIFMHTMEVGGVSKLRAVATDGHRLAKTEIDAPDGAVGMPGIIIPRKTVSEVDKLLEGNETVQVSVSDSKIRFSVPSGVLTSKLIDGTFPDYQRVIPPLSNNKARAARTEMATCVDRVSTVAAGKARAVKMTFSEDGCQMHVRSPDFGEAQEELSLDYGGELIEIGFNAAYINDILANIDADEVEIFLTDAGSPTRIHSAGDAATTYVLMPMRV